VCTALKGRSIRVPVQTAELDRRLQVVRWARAVRVSRSEHTLPLCSTTTLTCVFLGPGRSNFAEEIRLFDSSHVVCSVSIDLIVCLHTLPVYSKLSQEITILLSGSARKDAHMLHRLPPLADHLAQQRCVPGLICPSNRLLIT
jgi:hypothetical protein